MRVYIVESDSYYREDTLEGFKKCIYGEEDLYRVDGDILYYRDTVIGHAKYGCAYCDDHFTTEALYQYSGHCSLECYHRNTGTGSDIYDDQ